MRNSRINIKLNLSKHYKIGMTTFILCFIFSPTQAHAYVDPGSGSVIVTTILGIFAAIGYTCRKYFYKIKRLIFGSKTKENQTSEK